MVAQWQRALRIALDNEPADLILSNAQVVNVFTGTIERASVAISAGRIVGVGD